MKCEDKGVYLRDVEKTCDSCDGKGEIATYGDPGRHCDVPTPVEIYEACYKCEGSGKIVASRSSFCSCENGKRAKRLFVAKLGIGILALASVIALLTKLAILIQNLL